MYSNRSIKLNLLSKTKIMTHKALLLFTLFISFSFLSCDPYNPGEKIELDFGYAYYNTDKGRIDGPYVSYYSNGQKRAEGHFENNLRKGEWSVWDSLGELQIERDYFTHLYFEQELPALSKEQKKIMAEDSSRLIYYNDLGYLNYYEITEQILYWSSRTWRQISPLNNEALFAPALFNTLRAEIQSSKIHTYTSDELRKELDTVVFEGKKLIAFRIMEDFYFDNHRFISETQIIALAPIVVDLKTKDTSELYWVFYPQVREYIAQISYTTAQSSKLKNLDDIFFYRDFASKIYKTENVYDRALVDYIPANEIAKEAQKLEFFHFEEEHDLWMKFAGK